MILDDTGVPPPPAGSNLWLNLFGYLLIVVESGLIGIITGNYIRMFRALPKGRRLLPTHVALIGTSTFLLSATSVIRAIQFPRVWWGIATFVPVIGITIALAIILRWQNTMKDKKENSS